MAKACLALAFLVSALSFALPHVYLHASVDPGRFFNIAMFVPAILLGAASWIRHRSFANAWPVVLCVLVVWAGLVHADQTDSKRGLYQAVTISMVLPIAALIVQEQAWWFCVRLYVIANTVAMLITAWFQYVVEGGLMQFGSIRFGMLCVGKYNIGVTNPNEVGAQLAIACLLGFLLYLKAGLRSRDRIDRDGAPARFSLAWTVLLSGGVMLTASRSAFVAWFVGMGVLALWGTGAQELSRLKDLVAVSVIGLISVLFCATALGLAPWEGMADRFLEDDTVTSLGSRTGIWQNALRAWESKSKYIVFGAGTGMSGEVLGMVDEGARLDSYGNPVRSCHSTPVDWLLSYGLVGATAVLWLMLAVAYRATQLDCRGPIPYRKAILACGLMLALTGVIHQGSFWIALGSLGLGMLSDAPATGAAERSSQPATALPFEWGASLDAQYACRTAGIIRPTRELLLRRNRP